MIDSITLIAILLGVLFSVLAGVLALAVQIRRSEKLRAAENERRFHSHISDLRERLEEQTFALQRELAENRARFAEVNHLVLAGQRQQERFRDSDGSYWAEFRSEPYNSRRFLESLRIRTKDLKIDPTLVFVLTPFTASQRNVYDTIVEAFSDSKLTVLRGDERHIDGEILPSIVENILKARLIIANIEGRTPNVMYELGIAHALGKDVFVLAGNLSGPEELPFDIRSRRVIFYQGSRDLIDKLRSNIIKQFFS